MYNDNDVEVKTPEGTDMYFVSVYDVTRNFGGPEEGGWWYDSGVLVSVVGCLTKEDADRVYDTLINEFPRTNKRYSVLGGEDYNVTISNQLPAFYFPEERPRYG